jgi:hypothetical protein
MCRDELSKIRLIVGGYLAAHRASRQNTNNFSAGCFWIGSDRVCIRPQQLIGHVPQEITRVCRASHSPGSGRRDRA